MNFITYKLSKLWLLEVCRNVTAFSEHYYFGMSVEGFIYAIHIIKSVTT